MACLHTEFHRHSSSGSLIIAINAKTKYRLHASAMLFYILPKKLHRIWI